MALRRTGFTPPSKEKIAEINQKKRERMIAKAKLPKPLRKAPVASQRVSKTKRAKKMEMKKKLCEDYGLPIIPCSRWGTAKAPTRTDLLKGMAWTVFSKFVRERDVEKPCITCGLPLAYGDIQAGHYVPVGNSSVILWFLEENVNGEHPVCNADFNGWHLVPMRKNMVWRYGEDVVEKLDHLAGQKSTVKLPEEYFVDIIKQYL